MYPDPTGTDLNSDECRALDDAFFTSDPTGYFRSKIDALFNLSAHPETGAQQTTAERTRFESILGAVASSRLPIGPEHRRLQVAVDAIQLRHQAAEAVLRLILARLTCRASEERCSLWMTLIQTPTSLHRVIEDLNARLENEGDQAFSITAGLLIPAPDGMTLDKDMRTAVLTALQWIGRAADIVSTGDIDLNAANNKIKHGVAARPDATTRVTFTTQAPADDGSVRLSSLTSGSAIDIFDTTVLEYLSLPPKQAGEERPGFERTLLRVDAPAILAETWMLSMIHGAVFHTCAYRHFGEVVTAMADHPGLAVGPTPQQVLGRHIVGMRFPVTTSGSGQVRRPAGMLLGDGTFVALTFGPWIEGVVVDG